MQMLTRYISDYSAGFEHKSRFIYLFESNIDNPVCNTMSTTLTSVII